MTNREKLYRSGSDYVIAGVCGGIADYFNIDTTIVRLIFVLMTLGGGSGLLVYIILWAVLPVNPKEINTKKENEPKLMSEKGVNVRQGTNLVGLILFIIGIFALSNQILPDIMRWNLFWPVILILVGLYLTLRKR